MPSRSTADTDSLQDDLAAFGLPPDAFDTPENAEPEEAHCTVDADNWPTVMVFLALQTQWRREFSGMSGELVWHGLPHSEIRATVDALGYLNQYSVIFAGIKTMESAALPLLNKRLLNDRT